MNTVTPNCSSARLRSSARVRALGGGLLLAGCLASSCKPRGGSSFTGLGFLPGRSDSVAHAVSSDGKIVVGASQSCAGLPTSSPVIELSDQEAFRWTAARGMVGLGRLPGSNFSEARAVSGNGNVIVGESGLGLLFRRAFRWTAASGMVDLGRLPGSSNTCATAVSGDGSVVVGYSDWAKGGQAFRWTAAGGMVGLGRLPGWTKSSSAAGLSSDGSVVVGRSSSATNQQAFLWTKASGMIGLGSFGAHAVSGNGKVVVGMSYRSAFRWTAETGIVELGQLPGGISSNPCGVSSDGSVVLGVSYSAPSGGGGLMPSEGFIWDGVNGMRHLHSVLTNEFHLNLTGWKSVFATGISADRKTIVGTGDHNGHYEAWMARLDRPLNAPAMKGKSQ